jgi:RNA polymerase sigma-70 factor, ECF subfamily
MVTNFHELYQKYSKDIYRFAYWLCGNQQDAEDITSETFVRALTSTGEIRTETVKGYLLTIAKNLAFKRIKQTKRLIHLTSHLVTDYQTEQLAETNLDLQSAMQFLQSLPEIDRAALLMHIQEELPYQEIAKILGLSVTAVKVKVHRIRIKLREHQMKAKELNL